jgi:hypothetical protein
MTQRILQATTGSISWQPLDGDGEPAEPSGTVTVGVTSSDGTTVIAAGSPTSGSASDPRTKDLTIAQSAQLEVLTATWKIGSDTVAVTDHWIVGGFLYSIADLRIAEPSTGDGARDSTAMLRTAREEIEELFENATGVPWTPRLVVVRSTRSVNHDGFQLHTGVRYVRALRWCRLWSDEDTYTSLTTAECAAVPPSEDGTLVLPVSTSGFWQVTAAVEAGYFVGTPVGVQVPSDVRRAAMTAGRVSAQQSRSGIPDRATSMQMPDGGSVTLATPGVGRWRTGIPAVDEVLIRRDQRPIGHAI